MPNIIHSELFLKNREIISTDKKPTLLNPAVDDKRNLRYYFDEDLQMYLFVTMFESGFGINAGRVGPGSYMRRFNGMTMSNRTAMAHPYAIVVTQLVCTVDSSAQNAYFDCYHFDMNGSDEKLVGRLPFKEYDSQIGYATEKVKVFIPEFRRITIKSGGSSLSYPQGYYKYREVIEVEEEKDIIEDIKEVIEF